MKFSKLVSEEDRLISVQQQRLNAILKKRITERATTQLKREPTVKLRKQIRKEARTLVRGALKMGMDWLDK
jgi:hypothetical protein|tara:strand:+ start:965 stop:1177 length:213 start_codon:yes stop_codon:yes gene_type:complete